MVSVYFKFTTDVTSERITKISKYLMML